MGSNLRRTNVDSALLQTAVNRCYAFSTERSASSRVKSVRGGCCVCVYENARQLATLQTDISLGLYIEKKM